jgi:hypothetical protein
VWSGMELYLNVKIWGNRFALADSIYFSVKSISQQANRMRGRGGVWEMLSCALHTCTVKKR